MVTRIREEGASWVVERQSVDGRWNVIAVRPTRLDAVKAQHRFGSETISA